MMACACDHQPHLPCLHCQPQSFIAMVQNLIERCLLFRMTKDDCIRALAKTADIQPLVTLTVWEELVKENKGFFQEYHPAFSPRNFNSKPTNSAWKIIRPHEGEDDKIKIRKMQKSWTS